MPEPAAGAAAGAAAVPPPADCPAALPHADNALAVSAILAPHDAQKRGMFRTLREFQFVETAEFKALRGNSLASAVKVERTVSNSGSKGNQDNCAEFLAPSQFQG